MVNNIAIHTFLYADVVSISTFPHFFSLYVRKRVLSVENMRVTAYPAMCEIPREAKKHRHQQIIKLYKKQNQTATSRKNHKWQVSDT